MFLDYEKLCSALNSEIKEIKKIKRWTIYTYILGWFLIIFGPIIFLALRTHPHVLAFTPTIFDIATEDIVYVVSGYAIFFSALFGIAINFSAKATFQEQYKQIIVRGMVRELIEKSQLPEEYEEKDKEWDYHTSKRVSNRRMKHAGLFYLKPKDRAQGKDLVEGKLGSTTFQFATLSLYERKDKPTRNRIRRRRKKPKYKRKFKGFLFLADFNKHFSGHTLLRDKKLKSFAHVKRVIHLFLNRLLSKKEMDTIRLESKEFNDYFKTRTTDELEARYILTPNFMEKLVDFTKKRHYPLDVSFQKEYISMSVATKKSFYKPSVFKSMEGNQMKDVYNILLFFFTIIEELNLNTRIWSKD